MTTRGHELLAHTADVGLRATGPDLPALFEEAGSALADLMADVARGAVELPAETVRLEAADLPALAYAWLNELVGLADARRAALVGAAVERIDRRVLLGPVDRWHLVGVVGLVPLADPAVRPRLGVKSATYHRLVVEPVGDGWALTAYLDV